jgi:hypothetical protein
MIRGLIAVAKQILGCKPEVYELPEDCRGEGLLLDNDPRGVPETKPPEKLNK